MYSSCTVVHVPGTTHIHVYVVNVIKRYMYQYQCLFLDEHVYIQYYFFFELIQRDFGLHVVHVYMCTFSKMYPGTYMWVPMYIKFTCSMNVRLDQP